MLEKYKQNQADFYNYFINCKKNNKISHAYLIETNGVSYSNNLAKDLAKFFLCSGEDNCNNCNICNLIDLNNYPDLNVIEATNKQIKKEEMLNIQKTFSSKPIYGNKLIYIVEDASMLNSSSANTMLKFLEEPEEDIIAILLVEDASKVIDTIVSRCQIINLRNEDKNKMDNLLKNYTKEESEQIIKEVIEYFMLFEQKTKKFICSKTSYKFNDRLAILFNIGLNLYLDIFNKIKNESIEYIVGYEVEKETIMQKNEINDIINKINLINDFNKMINYNVNKELFIDNFLISMIRGGKND